jgi:hypothetical protein
MPIKARPIVADVLGCSTVVLLVLLWVVVPDPLKLHLTFPGGLQGIGFALLWVLVAPFLAGFWGRKSWFVVAVLAVITFVYVGFIYQPPLWY